MIRTEHIFYKTGGKLLLDDVSTRFEPGQLNLIIGPNGAGKSTLLKIISGLIPASGGSVHYESRPLSSIPLSELAAARGVLSQNIELAFPMPVKDVVMLGRHPHYRWQPGPGDVKICHEAMAAFEVTMLAERNYLTLSEGEKQRVHFARVLAQLWEPVRNGCRYLLLDEPLNALDIYYQLDLMKKLVTWAGQPDFVIVGVVHDLNLAAQFGHNILLLKDGKALAQGDRHSVFTKEHLLAAYRLEPEIRPAGDGSLQLVFK